MMMVITDSENADHLRLEDYMCN